METINIFEQLGAICNPANFSKKIYPLAAIWLERPLQTDTDRTVRITDGHKIRVVEDRILMDVKENYPATHIVISCHGTIGDKILFFNLVNLSTGSLLTLNIKP